MAVLVGFNRFDGRRVFVNPLNVERIEPYTTREARTVIHFGPGQGDHFIVVEGKIDDVAVRISRGLNATTAKRRE
ncbi:MAG TPA: hypothetical protein VG248_02850 [Caulobacteraceae bacterium]|nr:hypothetical protein [Caulobacteraceae bacterium]